MNEKKPYETPSFSRVKCICIPDNGYLHHAAWCPLAPLDKPTIRDVKCNCGASSGSALLDIGRRLVHGLSCPLALLEPDHDEKTEPSLWGDEPPAD